MSTNTNSSCRHYGCNRPFAQQQADSRGKEFHEATCHHRVVGCGSGAPCQRPLNAWLDACSSGKLMLSRCSEHNSSILVTAVKNDDRVLLTYLLDAVEPSNLLENLEAETSSGDTALTLAARCGRYRILRSLLEYISHRNCSLAVVHNETTRGATALIEATREDHYDCVDVLLRHAHSDPNRLSKVHAKSAIDWAADFDRDNILVELEKQSKVIKDFKLLCSVIARADVDTLREMVGAGEPYDIIRNIGYVSRLEVCVVDTEQTLEGHERDAKELPLAISGQTREIEIARGNLESASAEVSKQKQVVDAVVREEKDLIEGSDQLFRSGITSLQASMIPSNVAELSSLTKPGSDLMMISKVVVLLISAGREKGDESRATVTGNAKNLDEYWEEMLREMDNLQNFFHRLRHYDVNHRLTPEAAESIDDIITSGAINTTGDAHRIQPGAVGGGTGGSFLIQALASWAKAVHVCKANHGAGKEICNRLAQERQRLDRFTVVEQSRQNDLAVTERRRSMLRQEDEEAGKRLAMSNRKLRNVKQKLHLHRLMSHVSESGHSLLSWASAYGYEDVVDILIDHGANLGLGDEHLSLAARLIQETYRHYRWNTGTNMSRSNAESHQRHIAHRLLVKMYGRLLSHRRRHVRSPLAEAYFNGRPKLALLLEKRAPLFHLMMYRPRKPCGVIPRLALPMDKSAVQDISECIIQGRLLFESSSWEDDIGALEESEGEDNDSCDCMTHLTAMKKRAVVEVERLKRERACVRRARKHQTRLSQARIQMNQAIRESNYQMMVEIVGENTNEGEEDDEVQEWISLDRETNDGITPLIQAVMEADNRASVVSFLLDRKRGRPSIDYETKVGGDTALAVAARCGRLTAVEALLDRGATLNRQSSVTGETALIVAGKEGRPRVVQMLLERGSAVSIKDGDDRTARDYALENNHQDVVAIFEAYAQRGFVGLARAVYGTSHNSVLCQFGCGTMENMGERLDEHHRKCPRRPCRCPLCGMLVEAKDMSDHDENDCSERPVTCPLCQDRIALSSIDEHKAKECHKRKVECPRCSSRINADLVEKHKSYICHYRLVHCSLGCGSQVEFCDLQRHRRSECPRRTVRCKKCNDLLPLDELKEHEARDICAGNYNRS